MWTKKKMLAELKRLHKYYNMDNAPLQAVIDYIVMHPRSVRRDFLNAVVKADFPELRGKK